MIKTYKMFLALMLCALGAISVSAGDRIPLTNDMFYSYEKDQYGADAALIGKFTPSEADAVPFGTASGCPFGDTNCNAWIDCTKYAKLYIKMAGCDADGNLNDTNPRVFINRTVDKGVYDEDKSKSQCLIIPCNGWGTEFYTVEDDTYVVDLTKIKKEWGYCHLHAIKGSAWNTKAIVYSVEVEEASKEQMVGWINLIDNYDMEGDDNSFFMKKEAPLGDEGVTACTIEDGIGMLVGETASRGVKVHAEPRTKDDQDYQTQFWIYFKDSIEAGTRVRLSFDYKATAAISCATQSHDTPSGYIFYQLFGNVDFTTEWQHYSKEIEVTADQAANKDGKLFRSVAINLSPAADAEAIDYFFDNVKFEYYKVGAAAQYASNFVLLDFGFPTNIPELVAKTGKSRLIFPKECVTVKYGEESFDIQEVSAFADGRFYIFIDGDDAISDWLDEGEKVTVTFTNPADEQFHLVYADGNLKGQDVKNFEGTATANEELATVTDAIPYGLIRPTLVSADPEEGSFNLPNSIKEFKVTFDKPTQGDKLVAKLGDINLTVAPKELAETFTLTREGGDLATGEYVITLSNIHPEITRAEGGEISYKFGVGHVEVDPNDTTKTFVPVSYFENCANGGIPEGFKLYADIPQGQTDPELRQPGTSYSGGARVMAFAAGGDFTKGLYMRTWYLEYGTTNNYKLDFTAGKNYNISFNAANWTSGNRYLNFQIFKEADLENAVFSQVVDCSAPALGEKADKAVTGSTKTKIAFTPEETANYVMRWVVAKDVNGTATNNDWQNGVILANVEVSYMPNVPGMASILLLNEALTNAKKVQEGNTAKRYAGEAFTTLSEAITKYEAEGQAYTRPSDYEAAAAALDAASSTMQNHHILCDNYDAAVKKAIDVVRQNEMPDGDPNKATKFTKTEKFADLKATVEKYHGVSEWKRDTVSITWNEETLQNDTVLSDWYLKYEYDVLTDDEALTPAIAELQAIGNETALLFTEGASSIGKTGVAALTERLRLGGETLKTLNVNDEALLAEINNALTDDDVLAEKVKTAIKLALYDTLTVDADFLKPTVTIDEQTLEETTTPKSIDMTVFVKNPNIYVTTGSNFTAETVPGWTTPEGFSAPGMSTGWSDPRNGVDAPVDCSFQTWGGAYRVQQIITDLPAGVYTLQMGYGERMDDGELNESYAYAATSDSITVETETSIDEETLEEVTKTNTIIKFAKAQAKVIGQSFPNATGSGAGVLTIDSLVVTDGVLYIGVNAPSNSHTFFNEVRLSITGESAGFDYKKAADEIKQEIIEGIEPQAAQVKVRALQLFDLNGRRITTARPGIVIVKKLMNDGSVRIEKVVKK